MSKEEKKDFLYCLETITRFHVTALHLLSRPDFATDGFSEQQEIEQLSKTLISLMEAYEDCAKEGILCENEAEFRGYYIVFNAGDPALMENDLLKSADARDSIWDLVVSTDYPFVVWIPQIDLEHVVGFTPSSVAES